jgi:6-phosphogluconolactonase (cycloisomerase 2 family)
MCSLSLNVQYSGGTILAIPLSSTPPYLLEPKQGPISFEGSGPNKSRQEASHPHQVIVHRDEVLVPDLGVDKTWRLKEEEGGWKVVGSLSHGAGKGPRHAVIHSKSSSV